MANRKLFLQIALCGPLAKLFKATRLYTEVSKITLFKY